MEAAQPWPEPPSTPSAVIDGGGEEWDVLGDIMQRQLDALRAGDVLEVISHSPAVRTAIPTWCALHGHQLVAVQAAGDALCFWVQRGREGE